MNNILSELINQLREGEFSSLVQKQQIIDDLTGKTLLLFPDIQDFVVLLNELDYKMFSEIMSHLFKSFELKEDRQQFLAMVMKNKVNDVQSESQRILELLSRFLAADNSLGAQQIILEIADLHTGTGSRLLPSHVATPLAKMYKQSASVFNNIKHEEFTNPETAFMFYLSIGLTGNTPRPVIAILNKFMSTTVHLVIQFNKKDAKKVEKWIQKQSEGFKNQFRSLTGFPSDMAVRPDINNAEACLNVLTEYIRQQGHRESQLLKKISTLELEITGERSSYNRLAEQMSATNEEKQQALFKIEILKKECDSLLSDIVHLKELNVEQKKENEDKIQTLSGLVKQEALSKVNDFKGKLSDLLKIEFDDLAMVVDEEMTTDLGNSLREQLKSIFRLLDREGIICGK